jgi:hypothetical protein
MLGKCMTQARSFTTRAPAKRYFLVEYNYVEDTYYKRSKFANSRMLHIVPHKENH